MSVINDLLKDVPLPPIVRVSQKFDASHIENPSAELASKLTLHRSLSRVKAGDTVAVCAGSRGISHLPEITREAVRAVRSAGGIPFIIPAMGSHGGATDEGQKKMLYSMGLTEEYLEAPIRSSMETVKICETADGCPVYQDRLAYEADWVVPINRIKAHTTFRGKYESGLVKMLIVGMGKQKGADSFHAPGPAKMGKNLERMIEAAAPRYKVLFGVAVLENAFHDIAHIEVLDISAILEMEPSLLKRSNELAPKIPFDNLDVLILKEFGKDISGTGADVNVLGRYTASTMHGGPEITKIAVLNLTKKTGGNANGIGIMDFITRKVYNQLSFEETYPNSLTTTVTASVRIPMVLDSDKLAVQAAVKTCNRQDLNDVRLVMIKNTLELSALTVSQNLLEEIKNNPSISLDERAVWQFTEDGELL